jgi:hypothetical protein
MGQEAEAHAAWETQAAARVWEDTMRHFQWVNLQILWEPESSYALQNMGPDFYSWFTGPEVTYIKGTRIAKRNI